MTNFLNLPDWEVVSVKQSANDYRVEATYTPVPERCPYCPESLFAAKVYRHGTFEQEVMDLPSHGKRVGIAVKRVRMLFGSRSQKRPPYNGDECGSSGGDDKYAPEELGDTYGADVDLLLKELDSDQ